MKKQFETPSVIKKTTRKFAKGNKKLGKYKTPRKTNIQMFEEFGKLEERFATASGQFLQEVFSELGYDDFDEFIQDNDGAKEALMEWILTIPEFVKKLKDSEIEGIDNWVDKDEENED